MRNVTVNSIGDYIREQREQARISMRQLAQAAGVSNPYLSQIERGLRKPSADILQQIAKGLRISAEALYVQAGILDDRPADSGVRDALLADSELSERQKQVLMEVYESFRRENAVAAEEAARAAQAEAAQAEAAQAVPDTAQAEPDAGADPEDPETPQPAAAAAPETPQPAAAADPETPQPAAAADPETPQPAAAADPETPQPAAAAPETHQPAPSTPDGDISEVA
jgi:transcriptional regulator with XRE-family HTH domain